MLRLFFIFVKIGAILLGGGYVILPILRDEFVIKRNLVSENELVDYFALSQALPGIIAANISLFIGYKLKGFWGALCAMVGVTLVPFWTIVILSSILNSLSNNNIIKSAMSGIDIAVIVLIFLTVRELWQKSDKDGFFYAIFILSFFALFFFKFSPIQVIVFFSLFGVAAKKIIGEKKV